MFECKDSSLRKLCLPLRYHYFGLRGKISIHPALTSSSFEKRRSLRRFGINDNPKKRGWDINSIPPSSCSFSWTWAALYGLVLSCCKWAPLRLVKPGYFWLNFLIAVEIYVDGSTVWKQLKIVHNLIISRNLIITHNYWINLN